MGLLDNLKTKLAPAKEKVSDFAQHTAPKVEHGLDKAAKVIDEKTKGKYSDKIHTGAGKAKGAVERIAHSDTGHPDTGTATGGRTPPETPKPPPAS